MDALVSTVEEPRDGVHDVDDLRTTTLSLTMLRKTVYVQEHGTHQGSSPIGSFDMRKEPFDVLLDLLGEGNVLPVLVVKEEES